MAFPAGWPPRPPSGIRSLRFFVTDTATALFSDKAYIFAAQTGASTIVPMPFVAPGSTAQVKIGDYQTPGSPQGGGRDPNDANITLPSADQAVPVPMAWSGNMRICNDGAPALEYSFDGINVQGKLLAGEKFEYYTRHEAGIAVRGAGAVYRIEAW